MSLSVLLHNAPDGDDGPFHLASANEWAAFTKWVESLPKSATTYPHLNKLVNTGTVDNSRNLSLELKAVRPYVVPGGNVPVTYKVLTRYVGVGDPEETVSIVD